jgi:polyisoprenyl-teichoic acid--peptidoglycan teichoic acid transferase
MGSPSDLAGTKPGSRASVAALLSVVVPGWGQAYVGQQRLAYRLLTVDLVLVATTLLILARFRVETLKVWVSPDALLAVMAVNLLLLAYRALVASGAFRAAATKDTGMATAGRGLVGSVLLLAPHLLLGSLAWTQYDLITTVFAPPPVAAGSTTATAGPPTTTAPGPGSTTIPPTTTTTAIPTIWDGVDRLNIALLGSDMRPDQEELDPESPRYVGHRTDIMIVVSINPSPPYDVALLPVPRFLSNFEMPEGYGVRPSLDEWDWIGHVWRRAEDIAPQLYPGPGRPGANAVKTVLGGLFDIPIHYYTLVTVGGFIDLVDAFGGVTIEVPTRIVDRTYDTADDHDGATRTTMVIEAGSQHLDGYHALAYARIRSQSHEYARMHRQRCIISAMVEQTSPLTLVLNFDRIAGAIKDNVLTDIPQDRLVDFVDLLPNLDTDNFTTLPIDESYEIEAPVSGIRYYDLDLIKAHAQLVLSDPQRARAELGLSGLDSNCEESLDP